MPKSKWEPKVDIHFHEISDACFARSLAEIGELIYKEIRSRQLHRIKSVPFIATETQKPNGQKRKVVDG